MIGMIATRTLSSAIEAVEAVGAIDTIKAIEAIEANEAIEAIIGDYLSGHYIILIVNELI